MNKNNDIPPAFNKINQRLRDRIIDHCGSIRQFAIWAGIERTQVYPILRGEALPGLRNFVSIATVLDLKLDELAELLGLDPRKDSK